ncbi:MAG: hypothetical protein JKY37_25090 [Nannocystaceae bacterium]|nr:hypothetical protein [Nannocystaceae bacterium]
MEQHFIDAVASSGHTYAHHEAALRVGGSSAVDVLNRHLHDADPIARLLARVLLEQPRVPAYQSAVAHLEKLPIALARTPAGGPRPSMVQDFLNQDYGADLVEFVGLRLAKEKSAQGWRVLGFILYLGDHRVVSTSEALIRFATETTDESWRGFAVDAVRGFDDPDLATKLDAEEARARVAGHEMPPLVRTLRR